MCTGKRKTIVGKTKTNSIREKKLDSYVITSKISTFKLNFSSNSF